MGGLGTKKSMNISFEEEKERLKYDAPGNIVVTRENKKQKKVVEKFSLRIPKELLNSVRKVSEKRDQSINKFIVHCIRKEIESNKKNE